jgi:hypothetical protein
VETNRPLCFHELNHKLLAAPRRCVCVFTLSRLPKLLYKPAGPGADTVRFGRAFGIVRRNLSAESVLLSKLEFIDEMTIYKVIQI